MCTVIPDLPKPDKSKKREHGPVSTLHTRTPVPVSGTPASISLGLGRTKGTFRTAVRAMLVAVAVLLAGCGGTVGEQKRINLFEGSAAQEAMTALAGKIGHPAKVLSINITPLSLSVLVQDPAQPMRINEYGIEHVYWLDGLYHQARLYGPKAVQPTLVHSNVKDNLFDLSEVNVAGVPAAAAAAVNRVAIEGGTALAIRIQRRLFLVPTAHCGDIEWEIKVRSDREHASAYADAKGHLTRVNLDGTNRARNLNLLADAKELQYVVGLVRETFGKTPSIAKLYLNSNFLSLEARDPQKPKRLMTFTANLNGVQMRSDALEGGSAGQPFPEDRFFAVDDADWGCIPEVLRQARIKLDMPKGSLYKFTLGKPVFGGAAQPVRWTVVIQNEEGERGEVEFDARGTVAQVRLPADKQIQSSMFQPHGAGKAILGIQKVFGPHAKLIELQFAERYAAITAYSPSQPGQLREFLYQEDHFVDLPTSNLASFYRGLKPESAFDLDEIAAAFLPKLQQLERTALQRMRLTDGKIESITITRHPKMRPASKRVTIEINVANGDQNGRVSFDLQGNIVSVTAP